MPDAPRSHLHDVAREYSNAPTPLAPSCSATTDARSLEQLTSELLDVHPTSDAGRLTLDPYSETWSRPRRGRLREAGSTTSSRPSSPRLGSSVSIECVGGRSSGDGNPSPARSGGDQPADQRGQVRAGKPSRDPDRAVSAPTARTDRDRQRHRASNPRASPTCLELGSSARSPSSR